MAATDPKRPLDVVASSMGSNQKKQTKKEKRDFMKKLLIVLAISVYVTGCVTFVDTVPEGYDGPTAKIVDSYTNFEGSSAHYFTFAMIDGQYIDNSGNQTRIKNQGKGFNMTPVMVTHDVPVEELNITLAGYVFFATDAQGMFGDSMLVEGDLTFTPVANETYTVRGELTKKKSTIWLEDSAGDLVGQRFVEEKE